VRTVNRFLARALLICAALAALSVPPSARAQFTGKVSATGQFESDSNVFALDTGAAQPVAGDAHRGDTFLGYGAGLDGKYNWDRQELYANATVNEYLYQRFTELDHDAYSFDGGLNWKLGELFDGKMDVSRTRSMVPFFDLSGSELALSIATTQTETAQIGIKLSSKWSLQGSASTIKTEEPIGNSPDLQLTQTSGGAAINYQGVGGLTTGLTTAYVTGDYSGVNGVANPSYSQTAVGFSASYKYTRSTFDGQIGYSRRDSSDGSDRTSGVTGLFDFKEQLTPKTSFAIKLDRTINSYFLNAGSEIDTEAAVNIMWQATYKLAVTTGYTFTYRDYPGQGNNPVGSNRVDIQQYASLGIAYQVQRWLMIRPYANLQKRISTFIGGEYSATAYGVYVTVTYPDRPR
jgi:hypothetical protein